jgi:hypothetical protein
VKQQDRVTENLLKLIDNFLQKDGKKLEEKRKNIVNKDKLSQKQIIEDFVFIEDTTHGRIQDDISPYEVFSEDGWNKHKLWIYHPEGNIKRSYHLDGRQGTRKYTSDDLIWGYSE